MVAARRNAPITTTFGLLNALGYPAGTDEVSSDVEFRRSARKVFGLLPELRLRNIVRSQAASTEGRSDYRAVGREG